MITKSVIENWLDQFDTIKEYSIETIGGGVVEIKLYMKNEYVFDVLAENDISYLFEKQFFGMKSIGSRFDFIYYFDN